MELSAIRLSLGRHQREAQKNPIEFVENFQKKADIGLPYHRELFSCQRLGTSIPIALGTLEGNVKIIKGILEELI